MKKLFISLLLFVYVILFVYPIFAQSKILINEFLIDPQPQSVEIFNSGTESADISDWIIDDSSGTTFYTISKDSIIFPNQCLIFSADFNLNKTSGDIVQLINHSQQLVDSFSYKSSSGSGISYFRFPDNNNYWTTGSANLGFYNQTNISCLITPTQMPTSTPSPTIIQIQPTSTDLPAVTLVEAGSTDLTNIYLSEVMVNPVSGEKEWVEIYNNNDFPVSLSNWYVDDLENAGSSPKIFSLEIAQKSFGVFNLTSSMFNNDGDSVRLLDFNKNLKDDFEYSKTETGKTLGRPSFDSDDFCLQEPSKNSVNNSCINPTPTPITPTPTERVILSSTINNPLSKIPINMGRETRPLQYLSSISYPLSSDVLGISDELMINSPNNKLLINLLTILSCSYSLLTIISILFRMKLLYGKNKNFYSPPLHSS